MSWTTSKRKQRLRGAGVSGWEEQRQARRVLERDRYRCYLCGQPARRVDHVLNLAAGGPDTDDNKRAICGDCHRAKTAREAAASRPRLQRPAERHPGRT